VVCDRSLRLARDGYLFTASLTGPERRALANEGAVELRVLGRRALMVRGTAGVELFYDQDLLGRRRAVPRLIADGLFGRGALHGLDDAAHLQRKEFFLESLGTARVHDLFALVDGNLTDELRRWRLRGAGNVYDTAVHVYGRSVIEWAGIVESRAAAGRHAVDLARIVDGFGVVGPAYVRARAARMRADRWVSQLVRRVRSGELAPAGDSALARIAAHPDASGELLPEHTAAVELINLLRPTIAVAWLAAFAALALSEQPQWRARLADEARTGASTYAAAFANEVRRFYPFVPVLAARARRDFSWQGHNLVRGQRVLLDVFGTNHDQEWNHPETFDPERFIGTDPAHLTRFVPQGGGPVDTGHRCPGEGVTVGLLTLTVRALARLDVAATDAGDAPIDMRRVPTKPRGGVSITLSR
jgi:fatty-acid peroxygenase